MQDRISTAFADSKPHYALLDGLRGVAALLVVWYHIFEGYAFAGGKATFRIYFTHDRNSISEYYDMFSSDYSIDDFFVVKFKSVGKGRQMTSAVVHSNRIEGAKEGKSVELEVKKFLITFNIT